MNNTGILSRKHGQRILAVLLALIVCIANPQPGRAATSGLTGLLFEPQALPLGTDRVQAGLATLPPGISSDSQVESQAEVPRSLAPLAGTAQETAALSASIEALETDEGPYSPRLVPHLMALASIRQRDQDHAGAIEAASRAAQISRAGFGLDTPEQFPAAELAISSHLALQDYQQALEQQRALFNLYQSFYGPDALEAVPQLATLGGMYFAAFDRGLYRMPGGSGLEMTRGPESAYADPERLSNEDKAFLWLVQAQNSYVEAIRILLKRGDYADPVLMSLESNVIRTLFLQAHRRELEREPDFFMSATDTRTRTLLDAEYEATRLRFHRDGERTYQRMLSYQANLPNRQPLQIATTLLQLGDWHLLFGRYRQSREVYALAREFLQENAVSEIDMDRLLNPAVPTQLPVFLNQPHSLDRMAPDARADLSFEGFVDVAFNVSETGSVTDLEVLGTSTTASRDIIGRLRKVLRNAPFRPRLGKEESPARFELRYSFARL